MKVEFGWLSKDSNHDHILLIYDKDGRHIELPCNQALNLVRSIQDALNAYVQSPPFQQL